jgi:hypothetical protein
MEVLKEERVGGGWEGEERALIGNGLEEERGGGGSKENF